MADHAKPTLTSPYADFLSELMARVDDVAKGNNSGLTLANPPVGTVRWNTSTSKWESNTGTVAVPVWTALATLYSIRVATADAFTTGRTIAVTGDATGTSAAFTGAGNLSFAITFATVNANVGTFGSAAAVPVITVDAKGRVTAVGTAALGSMAAQSASNVAITGGTVSVSYAGSTGSGNTYGTSGFETRGNGVANTVFPSIGFHQPGAYAGTLQLKGDGIYYFYTNGGSLGTVYAATFSGNLSGTLGGLGLNPALNTAANSIVRTDSSGYTQFGYINISSGNEGNNSNPPRVWGTNGSDGYVRSYLTSALSVGAASKASTLAQNGGAGAAMTFNWSGQAGQPTWLWGGSDGVNHYVYNPSNFSVNYATSSGSCSGNAATATTASNALGVGQTWQDVGASRAVDVWYTNSTGRTIMVVVRVSLGAAKNCWLNITSMTPVGLYNGDTATHSVVMSLPIPAGITYMVNMSAGSSLQTWFELR